MALNTSDTVLLGQELICPEHFILQKLGLALVSGSWCSSVPEKSKLTAQEEGQPTNSVTTEI